MKKKKMGKNETKKMKIKLKREKTRHKKWQLKEKVEKWDKKMRQ